MIICCLTYIHMVNKKINNIPSLSHNTVPDAACPPVIDTLAALELQTTHTLSLRLTFVPPGMGGRRATASRDLPQW